ncbi:MAG TPA: hypothetical protein VMF32_13460 [Xanthobacteraceae bacterium]|jgi:hypothetical protein|nr:hypothetical protein [Xanthobacteraceae bacterium]
MRYRIDEMPRFLRSLAGKEPAAQKARRDHLVTSTKGQAKTAVSAPLANVLRCNISRKLANKKRINLLKNITIT